MFVISVLLGQFRGGRGNSPTNCPPPQFSCQNSSGTDLLEDFNTTKISNSGRLKKLYWPHALRATVFMLAKLMQAG